jgi:hypothetical protein
MITTKMSVGDAEARTFVSRRHALDVVHRSGNVARLPPLAMLDGSSLTFWGLFGRALVRAGSLVLLVGGFIVTFIGWVWKPDVNVTLPIALLCLGVLVWVLCAFVYALLDATSLLGATSIEVVKITKPRAPYKNSRGIFQLKLVTRLSVGHPLTFEWIDPDGYERSLGIGAIQQELENAYVVVTLDVVDDDDDDTKEFLNKLLNGVDNASKNLRVRDRMPNPLMMALVAKDPSALKGHGPQRHLPKPEPDAER